MNNTVETLGDASLLGLHKTGFLCSQRVAASVVFKSYDWAREQRTLGNCIVCGNHSTLERDVFEILLKGTQPLILVLARGMKQRWTAEILEALENNRLLIISPFKETTTRITRDTARERNRYMVALSDKVVVGYISKGGQLEKLLNNKEHQVL